MRQYSALIRFFYKQDADEVVKITIWETVLKSLLLYVENITKGKKRIAFIDDLCKKINKESIRIQAKLPREGDTVMSDDQYCKYQAELHFLAELELINLTFGDVKPKKPRK